MSEKTAIQPIPKIQTPEQLQKAMRDYNYASQPILNILADIEAVTIHNMRIVSGVVERVESYTPESEKQRAHCYEMLKDLRKDIFGEELTA